MSSLAVYHVNDPVQPQRLLNHADDIIRELSEIGVDFAQWQASAVLQPGASSEDIIAAYRTDIDKLIAAQGYQSFDVVSIKEDHPDREELRAKFLDEHTHSEDEVRFFVAGSGLFNLHVEDHVYAVFCEKGDLISVPAGSKHWFDMGEHPYFIAIRLFNNPQGWIAQYTGDSIAKDFPNMDDWK
ncbi:acireductone dioxygenase [Pseudomonas sp. F1_0610]|uniref:1,2-dihydroxy-3-keto-5-methylthiopentene dioxygenase n=1 Tax=Pseudomonas sp. F1_0610 TaxID=3114284 RepID=UPI0039C0A8AB